MKTYVVELKYISYKTVMLKAESEEHAIELANIDLIDEGYGEWETETAYEYAPERRRKENGT
jgi:hypothetical protein